ncbi:MAG: RNA polymerase sigma factor [Planctomycetes bacterium]|nr:RNA polymerase sigma factor [Planctomycetota bacterium]
MNSESTASEEDRAWRLAAAGNREALGTLLLRHSERLRVIACETGLDQAEAADAVQETFVRALLRWRDLKNPASLGTWLAQIVRHVAVDWLRRRARRPAPIRPESVPSRTVSKDDILAGLPEPAKSLLRMRYVDGLSGAEIAALHGVSLETVKKRIQRARAAALDPPIPIPAENGPDVFRALVGGMLEQMDTIQGDKVPEAGSSRALSAEEIKIRYPRWARFLETLKSIRQGTRDTVSGYLRPDQFERFNTLLGSSFQFGNFGVDVGLLNLMEPR